MWSELCQPFPFGFIVFYGVQLSVCYCAAITCADIIFKVIEWKWSTKVNLNLLMYSRLKKLYYYYYYWRVFMHLLGTRCSYRVVLKNSCNSTKCWKILVHIDKIQSGSCCIFVDCTSMIRISTYPIQRSSYACLGCIKWLLELLLVSCHLQAGWLFSSDINKTFSPRELLLTGYFVRAL